MRRPLIRRLALIVFGVITLAILLPMAAILFDGFTDEGEPADVAVVLGNTVHPDGRPSARLQARLDAAAGLYRAGRVPVLLVSGARGKEGHDEAVVMRGYLLAKGVPDTAIVVDSQGWTTGHTARNAAAWMRERGLTRATAVSQYFHVSRAKLSLRQCGVATVYGARARYFEWRDVYSIAREVPGWYKYRLRGCEAPGAPAPP